MSKENNLERDGFYVVEAVLDRREIDQLRNEIEALLPGRAVRTRTGRVFGARNLLTQLRSLKGIVEEKPLSSSVRKLIGEQARPVRCLFFDKNVSANWAVAWHQDLTIAVRRKRLVAGFKTWTLKAGVPHVQPPVSVLEKMLTIRLHLDLADEPNGALRVVPGSHRLGRLSPSLIKQLTTTRRSRTCTVDAGGALFMKPLLLHSSLSCTAPTHRRVVHIEFSADELPGGLEWYG